MEIEENRRNRVALFRAFDETSRCILDTLETI
jgi:hypothetical protein